METSDWLAAASLALAGVGLVIALSALTIAVRQLRHAETTNGGRSMALRINNVDKGDDGGLVIEYEGEVRGPAVFYDVIPFTWAGVGSPSQEPERIASFGCDDGLLAITSHVEDKAAETIQFGFLWREPWRGGLRTGGIRTSIDGPLEAWCYRPKLLERISRRQGRWVAQPHGRFAWGPASQPHEVPRRFRIPKRRNRLS